MIQSHIYNIVAQNIKRISVMRNIFNTNCCLSGHRVGSKTILYKLFKYTALVLD